MAGPQAEAKDRTDAWSLVIAALCLALASLLGWGGITGWRVERDLDHRGKPAAGTVVEVDDNSRCFATIGSAGCWTRIDVTVTYTDASGIPRRATRRGSEADRVGDTKAIVYDPIEPSHVRWDHDDDQVLENIVIGAVTAVAGAAFLVEPARSWRRRMRPTPRE